GRTMDLSRCQCAAPAWHISAITLARVQDSDHSSAPRVSVRVLRRVHGTANGSQASRLVLPTARTVRITAAGIDGRAGFGVAVRSSAARLRALDSTGGGVNAR